MYSNIAQTIKGRSNAALLPLLLGVLLLAACGGGKHEEVMETYANGQKRLVYVMKGKADKAVRVEERYYYEDGGLRWEKSFDEKTGLPNGLWRYFYGNGQLFAEGNFSTAATKGADWKFCQPNGKPLAAGRHDSTSVLAFTPEMLPTTLAYHKGDTADLFEFYENLAPRATGQLVGGKRNGLWLFRYPNGAKQAEAIYIDGMENGMHNSYRENGMPYFRGMYINGRRAGTWEFYDPNGELAGTKNFDE